MIQGQRSIDPRFEPGPPVPVDVLRPLISEQRILVLDGAAPMMVDLAGGDIRRWENGPPLSVPSVSSPFVLGAYEMILVQVQRDPRPATTDLVLLSVEAGGSCIDVIECSNGQLAIRGQGQSFHGPIGGSMAVVVSLHPTSEQGLVVKARNAESSDGFELQAELASPVATLTIGGPSAHVTGSFGRRRLIPAFVDAHVRKPKVDSRQRALTFTKRLTNKLSREAKGRIGR